MLDWLVEPRLDAVISSSDSWLGECDIAPSALVDDGADAVDDSDRDDERLCLLLWDLSEEWRDSRELESDSEVEKSIELVEEWAVDPSKYDLFAFLPFFESGAE